MVTCKFTYATGKPSYDLSALAILDILAGANIGLEGNVAAARGDK